jgi:Kef-type K+ transport system membrane component KefB
MNSILAVGLLLVIGFFGGIIARKFKLPTISGYIIIGMGLSVFNVIPKELTNGDLSVIVEISLGIIGYTQFQFLSNLPAPGYSNWCYLLRYCPGSYYCHNSGV